MTCEILSVKQLQEEMQKLNNWHLEENTLLRTLEFASRDEAKHFLTHIHQIAEQAKKSPETRLNDNNQLEITIRAHDHHGLTTQDISLAKKIAELISKEV